MAEESEISPKAVIGITSLFLPFALSERLSFVHFSDLLYH
jgi:hypothetical protein